MNNSFSTWICCQIGAREHYAIPRALHQQNKLTHLITDAWVTPQSILNFLPKSLLTNLRERFHPQLTSASISGFNNSLIKFEIKQKNTKKSSWQIIISRNQWYQKKAVEILNKIKINSAEPVTIFAYSYAALKIFEFAKKQGWQTILGQIDPGIYEEELVNKECSHYPQYISNWQPAPPKYWEHWQQECILADKILVNSDWSSQALQQVGINSTKIKIASLAYNPPKIANSYTRTYPENFSEKRPLKVLFLGQIILRKGIAKIFEAIELLKDEPIEFWFVGSINITIPQVIQNNPKIKWLGSVSRYTTTSYYQQADIFLFPTLSDGFGLTQLEAQAWQLPIIASKRCGAVVKDQINGLILPDITTQAIADALIYCQQNPHQLQKFAQQSYLTADFSLEKLSHRLQAIAHGSI
jgi:glycosyltransferase involved in cell wall biosynthesis